MPSRKTLLVVLSVFLVQQVVWALPASALSVWNLASDWNYLANPNGVWAFKQGSTLLPSQSDIGTPCCGGPSSGIGPGYAPSSNVGDFLPFWVKAVGDNSSFGFLAGDVLVHSVDSSNGDPSLGETALTWTAPSAGKIDISGDIWYAHFVVSRSNDFTLSLNGTTLASGTISATNGYDRSHPLAFGSMGLTVAQGDVVSLVVQRSPGQAGGSIDGVDLTISQLPEPGSVVLLAFGLPLFAWKQRRARQ